MRSAGSARSSSDQNPVHASDVANQLAQSFIDQRIDQTSETSDLARQFIQEQVLQTKAKLQKSEEELVAYAKRGYRWDEVGSVARFETLPPM